MNPSRKAFHELLDLLKEIDTAYLSEAYGIVSDEDVAEGEHMLTHLLKTGLSQVLDNDAARPHFTQVVAPDLKWGGDGPDQFVGYAPLEGSVGYRIRGRRRPDEVYTSFTVYRVEGEGGWGTATISHANHTDFDCDEEGRYGLVLSRERQPGAWLEIPEGFSVVFSRHYFQNERYAGADESLHVELRIDPLEAEAASRHLLPYAPERLAEKLRAVGAFLRANTLAHPRPGEGARPAWFSDTPNTFTAPERWEPGDQGGFGALDNAYAAAPYLLPPDEALVVEGRLPRCAYASLVLWNRFMQTYDYRVRSCGRNAAQMTLGPDRAYRLVLAHRDPGVGDWIDTCGRPFGLMYWRFLMPEGGIETPRTRRVALSELAGGS